MDKIKKIKGIIAVATAVFMLLSFAVPDVGMFGVLEVKAEVVSYIQLMDLAELFTSDIGEEKDKSYIITKDAVTIKKGSYYVNNELVQKPDYY